MASILYVIGGSSHVLKGYIPPNHFDQVVYCGRKNVNASDSHFLEYDLFDHNCNEALIDHIRSHDLDVSIIYAGYVSNGMSDHADLPEVIESFRYNCLMPVNLFSGVSQTCQDRKIAGVFISTIYAHVSPNKSFYKNSESQNPLYYGVFKAGVEQAVRWLSTQVREHRFNCVVLGPMPKYEATIADPGLILNLLRSMPSEGMVQQSELHQVLNLLVRQDLVSLRGQAIVLDGGYTLW